MRGVGNAPKDEKLCCASWMSFLHWGLEHPRRPKNIGVMREREHVLVQRRYVLPRVPGTHTGDGEFSSLSCMYDYRYGECVMREMNAVAGGIDRENSLLCRRDDWVLGVPLFRPRNTFLVILDTIIILALLF